MNLKSAIDYLVSVCDGAVTEDGRGFNGSDAAWGKRLARGFRVSGLNEMVEIRDRLTKYSKQLERAGIELPTDEELEILCESAIVEEKRSWHNINIDHHAEVHPQIAIALTYFRDELSEFGDSLLTQILSGKRLTEKQQLAAVRMVLKSFPEAVELGFTLTEELLLDWQKSIEQSKPQRPSGEVKLMGNALIVSFDYDQCKVQACKSISGAKWNAEGKFWQFPLSAAESLAATFPDFEFDTAIRDRVQSAKAESLAIQALKASETQRLIEAAAVDLPFSNGWTLYQHQKDAVVWAIDTIQNTDLRGVILALDMGTGKTMSGLTIARAYQRVFEIPVFVVCPASLKENWQREAEMVECGIEIFSWAKLPAPLDTQEYVVIFDEAHFAQAGAKSQRGKKFLELSRHSNCKAAIALTGTPIKNGRPINLLPLLQACNHPIAAKKSDYEIRYCDAKPTRFCPWDTTGAAHLDELSAKVKDVMLRITKKECLDLPEKTRVMRLAEVTGDRLKEWKQAYADAQEEYETNRGMNAGEALVLMGRLRKAASRAKLETAIELAQDILEQGSQVVIFTEFIDTAKALQSELGGELLLGETPNEERQPMVDRFQLGQSKVFISTSRAGGVGITLTAAQDVILVDRPWTPGDANQSEDRCHRIGQKNAVTAHWVQWGEIDFKIDSILEQKQDRIELVLQGKRKTLRGIKSPMDIAKELAEDLFGRKRR